MTYMHEHTDALYSRIRELEAENARLRAERDALKEYYAFISEYATMPGHTMPALKRIVWKIVSLGAHKP